MIRTIIVDDELLARENLKLLLSDFCENVEVVGEADSVDAAIDAITELKPTLVFLDIRMPSGIEGFELLEKIDTKDFVVIFVTAFKDYAIKAFNANAIHYILKPIDVEDLQNALKKVTEYFKMKKSLPLKDFNYSELLENLTLSLKNDCFCTPVIKPMKKTLCSSPSSQTLLFNFSVSCPCVAINNFKLGRSLTTLENAINIFQ